MIDIKIIKDEPERVAVELAARNITLSLGDEPVEFDQLVDIDVRRREAQQQIDELRSQQKEANTAEGGKDIKEQVKALEEAFKQLERDFRKLYLQLPNFHHESTPVGKDESENQVAKTVGKKPFLKNPKPHYEIPAIKPLIDFERGAKVSGSRFWFLKGDLVHLEFALIRYTLDFYAKKGFIAMRPPSIVRHLAMEGTGFLPAEASQLYELKDALDEGEDITGDVKLTASSVPEIEPKYLSGTAEVPLASYHAGEKLDPADLPIKYIGFAPAYRREAGSYGQDTKGILRGHEFDKLELFVFASPKTSWDLHEQLQTSAEEYWSSLGIPFQVLNMCTGDIGAPNAKKYDLEAWMPGESKYREVASNSHDTDFQARRLKIKSDGELVHTLNNTACAVGRAIIAIVENYQRENGTVGIPEVLHPYLPFKEIT